ncbi:unnamed protein product [Prorocentrum cordatum]|uniref:Uncharacterized protein n=1 Tax=Prorocentrum cordatum TaxID=2364126 RepID=A0ABN9S448_9DINO|nr:unnamed protein product [Polarella glacialis]
MRTAFLHIPTHSLCSVHPRAISAQGRLPCMHPLVSVALGAARLFVSFVPKLDPAIMSATSMSVPMALNHYSKEAFWAEVERIRQEGGRQDEVDRLTAAAEGIRCFCCLDLGVCYKDRDGLFANLDGCGDYDIVTCPSCAAGGAKDDGTASWSAAATPRRRTPASSRGGTGSGCSGSAPDGGHLGGCRPRQEDCRRRPRPRPGWAGAAGWLRRLCPSGRLPPVRRRTPRLPATGPAPLWRRPPPPLAGPAPRRRVPPRPPAAGHGPRAAGASRGCSGSGRPAGSGTPLAGRSRRRSRGSPPSNLPRTPRPWKDLDSTASPCRLCSRPWYPTSWRHGSRAPAANGGREDGKLLLSSRRLSRSGPSFGQDGSLGFRRF